ncbi:MAG: DMT family transporter [Chloroflexi bacterium CFX4]|nr:DMT family transporter [Chloroflexi bacterium CFX4]MDL1921221.1 DMT family transporter [Chloroflexi bacterium CFX3]
MQSTQTLRGALYGITAAALWGAMFVVSDAMMKVIPPLTLLSIRLGIAALMFIGIVAAQGKLRLPRRAALHLMLLGVLGFGMSVGLQFVGTALSSAINGSVITSASPAFIVLFAWLLLREPLTPLKLISGAVATLGVLIILDLSQFALGVGDTQRFIGDVALGIAAVGWGAYSVLIRRASTHFSTPVITTYALIGGFVFCAPIAVLELRETALPAPTFEILAGIFFLSVIVMGGANYLWNRAFALVEASVASLFFFAQPLVGALLSNWLLGQPITRELVIGAALIVIGVLLALQSERRIQAAARAAQT